jgi:hypothetical protein
VLCLIPPCDAASATFAGGTGEPGDPYQIATAQQLIAVGQDPNLLDKHFVLVADIDLDPNGPNGRVFQAPLISPEATVATVGDPQLEGPQFAGMLDGRGHTIRRLTLSLAGQGGTSGGGLFGAIGQTGVVRNLILADLRIAGRGTALGGLAGVNAGQVLRCKVSGSMDADVVGAAGSAGGLLGFNLAAVAQCCSAMQITGKVLLGGLVGRNEWGTVADSYFAGSVEASSLGWDGGLIGDNMQGRIVRCYAVGTVKPAGAAAVGGLAGYPAGRNSGPLTLIGLSYFLQQADGGGPDNGLGKALSSTQMRQQDSFARWDFYGSKTDGTDDTWFMPEGGYPVLSWETDKTGLVAVPQVRGLSREKAAEALAEAGLGLGSILGDYDPCVPAGQVLGTRPASLATPGESVDLWVSLGPYDWVQNPGDGTQANPYQLSLGGQLACLHLRPDLWHSSLILVDDLDMRYHPCTETLIAPDQNQADGAFQGTGFGGRLDGRGHSIRNLAITTGAWSLFVGMFGYVEQTAEIRNLRLENACVRTGSVGFYVGILAGQSFGAISDCSIQGTLISGPGSVFVGCMTGLQEGSLSRCGVDCYLLTSGNEIGGFAGTNVGQISGCAARGRIETPGVGPAGGIAGENSGGVSDSYSVMDIAMPAASHCTAAGLVGTVGIGGGWDVTANGDGHSIHIEHHWGYIENAFVRKCYAAGHISVATQFYPDSYVGGLTTYVPKPAAVTGSVWDMQATGCPYSDGGIGLTTQQMMNSQTLAAYGFDFANTWTICEGKDYPRLRWEGVQCEAAK